MENNINPDTMNNIKNLVDSGNISQAISQISPEMIENFSKILNSNQQNEPGNSTNSSNSNTTSQIDMNTILKMKSALDNMNNKNDPRSNLLYSLKPYLRQNKQQKLDQYVNLLNFSKVADMLKNDKKDDKNV